MAQVIWFKQSRGLATKIDPSRIAYDPKLGVMHLAEAYNVDFDFTGAIFRRSGYESTDITGVCHSLFWGGGDEAVFYKNGGLNLLAEDMTATQIRSGMSASHISYCQVGDAIAYTNGWQIGVIRNGTNHDFTRPPETHYPDPTQEYNDPPVGDLIRFFAGRVWISKGNTLWYSKPFAPNLFRLAVNYIPFPAKITMIAPVRAGLFVSTANKLYFMAGTNPKDMVQTVSAHYPAIKGTDIEVDGIAVGGGKISPLPMQMFTTTNGICVGTARDSCIILHMEFLSTPKHCLELLCILEINILLILVRGQRNLPFAYL